MLSQSDSKGQVDLEIESSLTVPSEEQRTADSEGFPTSVENLPEVGQEEATSAAGQEVLDKAEDTDLSTEEKETLAGMDVVLEPETEKGFSLLESKTSVELEEILETDLNAEKKSVSVEVEEALETKKKVSIQEAWMERDLISFDDETEELFQAAAEPGQTTVETSGDELMEKTSKDTEEEEKLEEKKLENEEYTEQKEGPKEKEQKEKKQEALVETELTLTADELRSSVTSDGCVDEVKDQRSLDATSPAESHDSVEEDEHTAGKKTS